MVGSDERHEAGHALLSNINTLFSVVHERVKLITEGGTVITCYCDRLKRAIEAVVIKRLELKQSPIIRRAAVRIPGRLNRACLIDYILIVGDDGEWSGRERNWDVVSLSQPSFE